MQNMATKKSDVSRRGTASAIREETRSGNVEKATTPDQPKRRTFSAEYKLRIIQEADVALASGVDGAVGALLRKEDLYSSHLSTWRREGAAGEIAGLTPRKRGRRNKNPLADENARLERELARVKAELAKANTIIDVQKKIAALLGDTLAVPTEEELAQAAKHFASNRLDVKGRR
jgi:transposase-like protein